MIPSRRFKKLYCQKLHFKPTDTMSIIKQTLPDQDPQYWDLTPMQRRLMDKREKEVQYIYTIKKKTKCQ